MLHLRGEFSINKDFKLSQASPLFNFTWTHTIRTALRSPGDTVAGGLFNLSYKSQKDNINALHGHL